MTISIIGSESFLAKNFIKYVENKSDNVRFKLYDYKESSTLSGYEYYQIDFSNNTSVGTIDFSCDAVMVFTGKTGTVAGFEEYEDFITVNEIYFLNILNMYVKNKGTARIIYPSSRLIYKELTDHSIDEDSAISLKSIYAVTKYASERYLEIYRNTFGIDYVVLHICTPFGSLMEEVGNYGTFEIFINQAKTEKQITVFGSGNQRKTFTDMQDICEAFYKLIDCKKPQHQTYNLGGQALSLIKIAEKIATEYNVPIIHKDWPEIYDKVDGGTVVFDSSRFDEEFNFTYRKIV